MSTNFYRNFSILRKKKGLTQEEIAEDLGVSRVNGRIRVP